MSAKNTLQEYCQKVAKSAGSSGLSKSTGLSESLPKYSTRRQDNTPDHAPLFIAQVLVCGQRFRGSPQKSKVLAEQAAASVAVEKLLSSTLGAKGKRKADLQATKGTTALAKEELNADLAYQMPADFTQIYLIDLENVPLGQQTFPADCWVLGFLGKCHHNAVGEAKKNLERRLDLRIIECSVKDAADHQLTFEAGVICAGLLAAHRSAEFHVISRDHCAEATVCAVRSRGFRAHHHTDYPQF